MAPGKYKGEMLEATDDQWAEFNLDVIKKSLFDHEDYSKWRQRKVDSMKASLRHNERCENEKMAKLCRDRLEEIDRTMPLLPVVPPSEKPGLEPIVYYRLLELEFMRDTAEFITDDDTVNIDAVMKAYRAGKLKVTLGTSSYWWAGHPIAAPCTGEADIQAITKEGKERYGEEGRIWCETVSAQQYMMGAQEAPNVTVYERIPHIYDPQTTNRDDFHSIHVSVRLATMLGPVPMNQFGGPPPDHHMLVIDDTGSSYLELFRDDLAALGLDPNNIDVQHVVGTVNLSTCNGLITRQKIRVELQWYSRDGRAMGPRIRCFAVAMPMETGTRNPSGGSTLRRVLYTATAPGHIGDGNLYLARCKTHLMNELPARALNP